MSNADEERKRRIEREIGLLALLGEDDGYTEERKTGSDEAIEHKTQGAEPIELASKDA